MDVSGTTIQQRTLTELDAESMTLTISRPMKCAVVAVVATDPMMTTMVMTLRTLTAI